MQIDLGIVAPDRTMGFTLMELLVVLTVIGLLAAIMATSMSRRPAYLGRERLVADLAGRMAKASNEARASGRPIAFELDQVIREPALSFVPAIGTAKMPIFFPDGSSNGGVVSMDRRPIIQIAWLDARIDRAAR